jgi:DNA-binding IclR family transcriptional regulator
MTPAWSAAVPGGENRSAEGRGVLAGAFQLLDALVDLSEAGLTAVSAASGLPKATAHRLLEQLCDLGAVERRGSRYRVGHRMFQLGRTWQPHPGLGAAAHNPVKALAQASGASVAVCVLRSGQTLIVGGVAGEQGAVPPISVGSTVPWRSAAGKVLVASCQTATMLTLAPASWARERETIREQGVAFDREEVLRGVCCVAVPVRGGDGDPVAAIAAITTPGTGLPHLAQGLRRAGDAITATLRGDPSL